MFLSKGNHQIAVILILTGIFLLTQYIPVKANPTAIDWGSFNASGLTTFGVYEADDVTILQTGDLAQLIWAGPNGTIEPPQPNGTTTGDDVLLDTTTVNNGLPLPPPLQNKGYIPLKTYSFDDQDPISGGVIYIRAWNAGTATSATAYGNSITSNLTPGGIFNAPRWHMTHSPTAITLSAFSASSYINNPWWLILVLGTLVVMIVAAVVFRKRSKLDIQS